MRRSTMIDITLRIEFNKVMGRRLVTGPLGLLGLARGMSIPGPIAVDKLAPCESAALTKFAMTGASTSDPYFRSSAGILSGPQAFPFRRRLRAVATSDSEMGVAREYGDGGGISPAVLALNCEEK